jgi:NAD(P)-dependent dehydrogenase (short-subunit alcohol dehydrogenase family)
MEVLYPADLRGRTALITGSSRGLGRAMAFGLARAGANVVITSRNGELCIATAKEIENEGGQALAFACDVSDMNRLDGLVEASVERFGGIDILINNAVEPSYTMLEDMSVEIFDRAYDVNVKGPTFLAQKALPHLSQSGHGVVINVISVAVWIGNESMALYRGTKSALLGMTKVMAKEWACKGVRVNALAPGPFETTAYVRDEERTRLTREATLLKRIASFEEIVPPILYMASDASAFMTGSVLTIDGGIMP